MTASCFSKADIFSSSVPLIALVLLGFMSANSGVVTPTGEMFFLPLRFPRQQNWQLHAQELCLVRVQSRTIGCQARHQWAVDNPQRILQPEDVSTPRLLIEFTEGLSVR